MRLSSTFQREDPFSDDDDSGVGGLTLTATQIFSILLPNTKVPFEFESNESKIL